ncbi:MULTISPECIES: hypothetical protein [pseudomallei group]|uniref:hypothetical protein n=1 Tax=pseudomallei group TaxID=111527 RepID=UPI0002E7CB32|nr:MULTISPECIES: hypothetical protein [pseudomallei group]KOS97641.1 non-ribosomal peptide synthetase modules domain protein [Burkholderia mallei]MDV2121988.1 hypothetical protein [Burkholderia pseudomallei]MDV2157682.1 hypothetical protein [Burkholderia pseudomallei]
MHSQANLAKRDLHRPPQARPQNARSQVRVLVDRALQCVQQRIETRTRVERDVRRRHSPAAAPLEPRPRRHTLARTGERNDSLDVRRTAVDGFGNPAQCVTV